MVPLLSLSQPLTSKMSQKSLPKVMVTFSGTANLLWLYKLMRSCSPSLRKRLRLMLMVLARAVLPSGSSMVGFANWKSQT